MAAGSRGYNEGSLVRGSAIVSESVGKLLVIVQSLEVLPDFQRRKPRCVFWG